MARRRIEMFQYRQALVRLRAGDSERDIARSGLMGRQKLAAVRELAQVQGWPFFAVNLLSLSSSSFPNTTREKRGAALNPTPINSFGWYLFTQ